MPEPGTPPVIGVIGGSGVYEIDGLAETRWQKVETPFGAPSDELLFGELDGQKLVFLPRHGRGHKVPPSELNFRANIDALKRAGVTEIVSVSAVGSLRAELPPGTFVVIDQFIDRTFARKKSFFESGLVAHVSMAEPVCRRLGTEIEEAARGLGLNVVRGGTYLVMEGPQFSTLRGIGAISQLGLRRDRHDQHAGSEARARGGDVLRDRRHGHRLRLLASARRGCHGGGRAEGAVRQRRSRARLDQGGDAAAFRPQRAMRGRLSHRARQRAHHRAPCARSGDGRAARRRGGKGLEGAMKVDGRSYRTIWTDGGAVEIIDQTRLPHDFVTLRLTTMEEAAHAIRSMQVRGAPLIGATAAYGLCLALARDASDAGLDAAYKTLLATRPTAVNLRWALDDMVRVVRPLPPAKRPEDAWRRAAEICDEDVALCEAIGRHGKAIIERAWRDTGGKRR